MPTPPPDKGSTQLNAVLQLTFCCWQRLHVFIMTITTKIPARISELWRAGTRGDPSADFALSTMCHPAAQPVLSKAFTAVAKACGLHRAPAPSLPTTHPVTSAATGARTTGVVGGGAEADAQLDRDAARRREVGRQALEARLVAAGMQPGQGNVSASSSPGGQLGVSNGGSSAGGSPFIGDREKE